MQRQRGELVPIGDAFSELGGPVKAIRDATPQARHHFTVADQVNQLVSANEAYPDRGFLARTMALCCLPRSNPGNRKEYVRLNGPYALVMTAAASTSSPLATCPACCWPGSRRKQCVRSPASSSWGSLFPSSCARLGLAPFGGVRTRLRN